MKKNLTLFSCVLVLIITGYFAVLHFSRTNIQSPIDSAPKQVTLSGTYVCLPYIDTTKSSEECVFGLKTDGGEYYMVNFGQSGTAMEAFQNGEHIVAQGFVVPKEALSTDHWAPYNMK